MNQNKMEIQGAVYKIKCSNCDSVYIEETGRQLKIRKDKRKQCAKKGDESKNFRLPSRISNTAM